MQIQCRALAAKLINCLISNCTAFYTLILKCLPASQAFKSFAFIARGLYWILFMACSFFSFAPVFETSMLAVWCAACVLLQGLCTSKASSDLKSRLPRQTSVAHRLGWIHDTAGFRCLFLPGAVRSCINSVGFSLPN